MSLQAWIMMVQQGCVVVLLAVIAFMLKRWVDKLEANLAYVKDGISDHEVRLTVLEHDHERRSTERRSTERQQAQA